MVVVSETFEVTPYRALWFGVEDGCVSVSEGDRIGNGAIVSRPAIHGEPTKDTAFYRRYVAVKRTLGGRIDDRQVSLGSARRPHRTHVALRVEDGPRVVFGSGVDLQDSTTTPQSAATSIMTRLLGWQYLEGSSGTSVGPVSRFRESARPIELDVEYLVTNQQTSIHSA